MLITIISGGIVLAFAASLIAGRLGGLGITALYAATIAFFWMPPRFSLRVSQTQDIGALAFYGAAGLVVAKTAPSKKKRELPCVEPVCDFRSLKRAETDLSLVVANLMSTDLGARLRAVDFSCTCEDFSLPCTAEETLRMLSDTLTAALQTPEVCRVSICVVRRPNVRQLIVAAHYVFPTPPSAVITIGKRDGDCEPAAYLGWPVHSSLTWFDNGYDRIFQISVQTHPSAGIDRPDALQQESAGMQLLKTRDDDGLLS